MARDVEIGAGESFEFTVVLSMLPKTSGELPAETADMGEAGALTLMPRSARRNSPSSRIFTISFFPVRQIKTPDEAST